MAYEYNPLIPLNLQKKQDAATPGDIDRLQGEIDALTADVRDKVPKFFTSIEELEIDEIGEYQGMTGGDFVPGYFYKRNPIVSINYGSNYEQSCSRVLEVMREDSLYLSQYYKTLTAISSSQGMIRGDTTDGVYFMLLSPDFLIANNLPIYRSVRYGDSQLYDYYLFPYAVNLALNDLDYNNIVTVDDENNIVYNGKSYSASMLTLSDGITCWLAFDMSSPHLFYVWLRNHVDIAFLTDKDLQNIVFDGNLQFQTGQCHYNVIQTISITCTDYTFTENLPFVRVDTQPSLDPTDFATAAQGAKADTALQGITHGNDSNYVTSTIGAKDANNEQSVSVSLTLQPIATAGSGAKGVAEASDVKDYIVSNTATKEQGTAADTALQQVVHGTDGLYVTTTVTQKASNEQTIYTALTLQDVETADDTHKGVAEASNVRKMFNIISAQSEAYGVMWDTANPSPQCLRIGNMYNHQTLPVQSGMIGGVMADDGTFTPFDNQSDWTQATQARDGSDGQVMIKIPQHWQRLSQYGTIREKWISPVEMPGYIEIPTRYCGAYEASIERSTGKLCSVNNATADYRGGDNTSAWDNTYRTLLNRPVTYLNQSEFLAAARLRAAGTSWNNLLYKICRDVYWLFVTEYATLDSQADYNAALDANGFRQGGLGVGVTTWDGTSWDNFNSYNPFIPCGYLDEYGNQTAVKNFSLYNADSTLLKTFSVNSYRGIMLPFGHTWKHTADVLINVESGDGNSAVYLCDNPANFNSSSVANYNFICNQMRVDSYVKEMYFGDNADIIAIVGGGNSTSYYCDQQWCGSLPSSGSSLRCWLFGGHAAIGSRAGLACAYSRGDPGYRPRHLGSRLCFIP